MITSIENSGQTYCQDEALLRELGFQRFDNVPHAQEIHVGDVVAGNAGIRVFVTCMPAQFWRFKITTAEGRHLNIETGSGCLRQFWPAVKLVAAGLLTVREVEA